jgi:hypothetical protein
LRGASEVRRCFLPYLQALMDDHADSSATTPS